jgi:ABC-type nitrate/sulfonate/bicarbonate transport system permease component
MGDFTPRRRLSAFEIRAETEIAPSVVQAATATSVAVRSREKPTLARREPAALVLERRFGGISSICGLFLLWELIARVILPAINEHTAVLLPPPSLVLVTTYKAILSGDLFRHVAASTERVLVAWGLVCMLAIPLGIAMGWWQRVNRYAGPIVELLRPIPPLAWIPISILWFGIGISQNIFIIMIGTFFPVLLNTIHGVRGIDPILIRAARNFGAPPFKMLSRVVIFGALPSIFTGMRIGLGVAWMVLVAAELVAAVSGLGFLIMDARNFLQTDVIFMGMIIIGAMGITMELVLRTIEARILHWYYRSGRG